MYICLYVLWHSVQLLRGGGKGDAKGVKAELLSGKCQVHIKLKFLLYVCMYVRIVS